MKNLFSAWLGKSSHVVLLGWVGIVVYGASDSSNTLSTDIPQSWQLSYPPSLFYSTFVPFSVVLIHSSLEPGVLGRGHTKVFTVHTVAESPTKKLCPTEKETRSLPTTNRHLDINSRIILIAPSVTSFFGELDVTRNFENDHFNRFS